MHTRRRCFNLTPIFRQTKSLLYKLEPDAPDVLELLSLPQRRIARNDICGVGHEGSHIDGELLRLLILSEASLGLVHLCSCAPRANFSVARRVVEPFGWRCEFDGERPLETRMSFEMEARWTCCQAPCTLGTRLCRRTKIIPETAVSRKPERA